MINLSEQKWMSSTLLVWYITLLPPFFESVEFLFGFHFLLRHVCDAKDTPTATHTCAQVGILGARLVRALALPTN